MNLPNYLADDDGMHGSRERISHWVSELTDFTPQHVEEVVSQMQIRQQVNAPLLQ